MMARSRFVIASLLVTSGARVLGQTCQITVGPAETHTTIQSALDVALDGWTVCVQDGNYAGAGNRNLDFDGKGITLRSINGPSDCVIELGGTDLGFLFDDGENFGSVVEGIRIENVSGTHESGAVDCFSSSPKFVNCEFLNCRRSSTDSDQGGGAIRCRERSSPMLVDCRFSGCAANRGGAIYADEGSSPAIVRCTFNDNTFHSEANDRLGGVLYLHTASALIHGSLFEFNAYSGGTQGYGGILYLDGARATITNCSITANDLNADGGVMYAVSNSDVMMSNCTVAENVGNGTNRIISLSGTSLTVKNSILWDNTPADPIQGSATVTYTDVPDISGTGNIDDDPEFRSGPFNYDYYLDHTAPDDSPCIDAGSDSADGLNLGGLTTQVDLTVDAGTVDMGFHSSGDCNENDVRDATEIGAGIEQDCNGNGIPDSCDIQKTSSDDFPSGGNGIPDECECLQADASWTTDADFAEGFYINVENSPGDVGKLRREPLATPLPYIWIPRQDRDTVVVALTDTNGVDGMTLGEYRTFPNRREAGGLPAYPTGTAVDLDGNCWIANRKATNSGGVRIGIIVGGMRCDADGNYSVDGDYLRPPFQYNTCIDRNNDGLIYTSREAGDVRDWWAFGDPDGPPNVELADDECICAYIDQTPTETRFVAVDRNNDVWFGGAQESSFEQYDDVSLALLQDFPGTVTSLGGLIDCQGVLWAATGSGSGSVLFRSGVASSLPDPDNGTSLTALTGSYAVGIDAAGKIWDARGNENVVSRVNPANGTADFTVNSQSAEHDRGIAVTLDDNEVWISHGTDASGTVTRLRNSDGALLETISLGSDGKRATGVAVASDGRVWVQCAHGDGATTTMKLIDPATNPATVYTPFSFDGAQEDGSYSDQTGQVTLHTTGTGTWNVVHDSGRPKAGWHRVTWNNGSTTAGLSVALRAADSEAALTSTAYVDVPDSANTITTGHGTRLYGVKGRYLQVRVRLRGSCPGTRFSSPELEDLVVRHRIGDANCDNEINFFDIDPFLLALFDPTAWHVAFPDCDILFSDGNDDGVVNFFDIDPFLAALFATPCSSL